MAALGREAGMSSGHLLTRTAPARERLDAYVDRGTDGAQVFGHVQDFLDESLLADA